MRTRVKICGLTRPQDVQAAVQAGADAIGLVFHSGSKRAVTPADAARLRLLVPAFVDVVALFVNATPDAVQEVMDVVQPDILQFHGDESPDQCRAYGRRYMKAFRVGGGVLDTPEAVAQTCAAYSDACAWLFDSFSEGYGGSGLTFDPHMLDEVGALDEPRALVLAGGLKPESVAASIAAVRPFAVDVSSGVEASPGIKSPDKIIAFISAVHGAARFSAGV